ncbi:MAG TPA: class II fructose-bisphosphate aldolase [Acidobacteriota bacterium]|nr:class II fructose-bisphosphate aldolase [Acidobacteriota bacterium]
MGNRTKQMFQAAYGKFGIGAFNVFSAEQVQAVFLGARRCQAPILVAVTPAARGYLSPEIIEGMIRGAGRAFPEVVFSVHLDHGNQSHCLDAIESGFYSSVMIDASHEEFEENIRATTEIVRVAHAVDVAVEAELGILGGVEDDISVEARMARVTDPDLAAQFVERTGCDSLAVAIGTSHGAYKFKGEAELEMDVLQRIGEKLPGFPLVLHGASAVPRSEIERINAAGGRLGMSASGVPERDIREAIRLGVCKINIATDMRLIWARAHREFFLDQPDKFDLIVPGKTHIEALARYVAEKCTTLGGQGMARMVSEVMDS